MLGVVGAETPAAELVLHLERAVLSSVGDVLALAVDGGVRPTLGIEAVGAADQKVVRIRLGQHPDVVLTFVLWERENMLKLRKCGNSSKVAIINCDSASPSVSFLCPILTFHTLVKKNHSVDRSVHCFYC